MMTRDPTPNSPARGAPVKARGAPEGDWIVLVTKVGVGVSTTDLGCWMKERGATSGVVGFGVTGAVGLTRVTGVVSGGIPVVEGTVTGGPEVVVVGRRGFLIVVEVVEVEGGGAVVEVDVVGGGLVVVEVGGYARVVGVVTLQMVVVVGFGL